MSNRWRCVLSDPANETSWVGEGETQLEAATKASHAMWRFALHYDDRPRHDAKTQDERREDTRHEYELARPENPNDNGERFSFDEREGDLFLLWGKGRMQIIEGVLYRKDKLR